MKVLLIMPRFFDYPQIISDELNRMGYEVDFFDDRPSTSSWVKAIIRVNKNLINNYIKKYFEHVMETVQSKRYDVVLVISGQSLSFSVNMMEKIKDSQQNAKFVLYQWDSIKNFSYIQRMYKYFDKCYSFDRRDVENDKNLRFLPLFYQKEYEKIGKMEISKYKYDFCFVGTAHPQKYRFIKMMSKQLKDICPEQFVYFYFPSRIVFFYRKIMNQELRKSYYNEFHFVPLKDEQMKEVYVNSRYILDSPQAGQIGLTIRVIEALGAKKKLITTNADITNYDFYREENIYVYDGHFDLDSPFFKTDYKEIEQDIYEKYSLRSWLRIILEG